MITHKLDETLFSVSTLVPDYAHVVQLEEFHVLLVSYNDVGAAMWFRAWDAKCYGPIMYNPTCSYPTDQDIPTPGQGLSWEDMPSGSEWIFELENGNA